MLKYQFQKEIKGQWNSVKVIDGNTIARVCWFDKSWLLVPEGTTFEQAKNREFEPIAFFISGSDLYDYIYKGQKFKYQNNRWSN